MSRRPSQHRTQPIPTGSSSKRARSSVTTFDNHTNLQVYDPAAYLAQDGLWQGGLASRAATQQAALLAQYGQLDIPMLPYGNFNVVGSDLTLPNSPPSLTDGSSVDGMMSRSTSISGHLEMLRIKSSISNAEDTFSDYHFSPGKSNDLTDPARSALLHGVGFGSCSGDGYLSPLSTAAPQMSATSSTASQDYLSSLESITEAHESMPAVVQSSSTPQFRNVPQNKTSTSSVRRGLQQYPAQMRDLQAQDLQPLPQSQYITQLVDITSADGTGIRSVASIPRTTYKRPAKQKLYCDICVDRPSFRGEHELTRHKERRHSTIRKCWIAVDKSPDGKWLSNCKHCRTEKKYNAYYNLAAHLRRIHFNKKDQGSRGRKRRSAPIPEAERKGGKSGGDTPSIEWLKDNGWIKEIDVMVLDDAPLVDDKLEDDDDFSMGDTAMAFDASIAELAASYEPAIPDTVWPSTYSRNGIAATTTISQPFQAYTSAMTPEGIGFTTTYSLGGDFGGQDSYYNL